MGTVIALTIISLWLFHLAFILNFSATDFTSPLFYLHIVIQSYLYTGLFITAHDAMHGNISKSYRINNTIGSTAAFLFAALSYKKLLANHKLHHEKPGSLEDPDFYTRSQNFFVWWLTFIYRYSTIRQIIFMGIAFNILKYFCNETALWFYWILPAFIGTLQLFYFGTYRPHRFPHTAEMEPHKARSQRTNHITAMLSCYFFGYHYEHHGSPGTPWWRLYSIKNGGRMN